MLLFQLTDIQSHRTLWYTPIYISTSVHTWCSKYGVWGMKRCRPITIVSAWREYSECNVLPAINWKWKEEAKLLINNYVLQKLMPPRQGNCFLLKRFCYHRPLSVRWTKRSWFIHKRLKTFINSLLKEIWFVSLLYRCWNINFQSGFL